MRGVPCSICHLLPLCSQGETKPYPTITYHHVCSQGGTKLNHTILTYVPRVARKEKEKRCVRLYLPLTHSLSFRPSYCHPPTSPSFLKLLKILLLEHINHERRGAKHVKLYSWAQTAWTEVPCCLFGRLGLSGRKMFVLYNCIVGENKQLQQQIKRWAFWQRLHSNAY